MVAQGHGAVRPLRLTPQNPSKPNNILILFVLSLQPNPVNDPSHPDYPPESLVLWTSEVLILGRTSTGCYVCSTCNGSASLGQPICPTCHSFLYPCVKDWGYWSNKRRMFRICTHAEIQGQIDPSLILDGFISEPGSTREVKVTKLTQEYMGRLMYGKVDAALPAAGMYLGYPGFRDCYFLPMGFFKGSTPKSSF